MHVIFHFLILMRCVFEFHYDSDDDEHACFYILGVSCEFVLIATSPLSASCFCAFFQAMAEGGGDLFSMSIQKLDDELTCPVCTEHFKEPKVLPCLHYYCKTCIADLIKRAPRGRPFNCPECRREVLAANDPER